MTKVRRPRQLVQVRRRGAAVVRACTHLDQLIGVARLGGIPRILLLLVPADITILRRAADKRMARGRHVGRRGEVPCTGSAAHQFARVSQWEEIENASVTKRHIELEPLGRNRVHIRSRPERRAARVIRFLLIPCIVRVIFPRHRAPLVPSTKDRDPRGQRLRAARVAVLCVNERRPMRRRRRRCWRRWRPRRRRWTQRLRYSWGRPWRRRRGRRRRTPRRLACAHHARVLLVGVGRNNAPATEAAVLQARLRSSASHVVHPDPPGAFAKARATRSRQSGAEAELRAYDLRVGHTPLVVRHRAPLAVVEDLDAALAGALATNEPHEAMDPWRRRRLQRRRRGRRTCWK